MITPSRRQTARTGRLSVARKTDSSVLAKEKRSIAREVRVNELSFCFEFEWRRRADPSQLGQIELSDNA